MLKRIRTIISEPKKLSLINLILILSIIVGNIFLQVFCIPSFWATIILTVCFLNTIFLPIMSKHTKWQPLFEFINGITFCVFIYCILFLEEMNFMGVILILFGIGLLIYIPYFFIFQLIWKSVINPPLKSTRWFFVLGLIVCLSGVLFVKQEYKAALTNIENFKNTNYSHLEKTFFIEKILGMHFIYHTRFCEFDGWRPPIHEPALVIGLWLNNNNDPLNIPLEDRISLYKKIYPLNPIKKDCSCAYSYKESYHNSELLK